jgi:hypothetical protein
MKTLRSHRIRLGFGMALIAIGFAAPAASAASPVGHAGESVHREVSRIYWPDDICGPRAGWTEVVVTVQWKYIERPDGSFNFHFMETGTYHTDFDDPTIADYDSQFTLAEHGTVTPGGTAVVTSQWHDFPGSITIQERIVVVQVGDEVKVDRYVLYVDGCP